MLLTNGLVMTPEGFVTGLSVRLCDDAISEISEKPEKPDGEKVIDLDGDYLLPGFVDVHIHGFMGQDTMQGEHAVRHMSRELAKIGVGAFCPTTMSATAEETRLAVNAVRSVMRMPEKHGARVLGAHMEAPFLNEKKAGAQNPDYFQDPDFENLKKMAGDLSAVRLITIAPERKGSDAFIRSATTAGIHVSIGHTDANAEQVHLAGDQGADHITHTFNAQTPLHHRYPGVPGAALTDDRFFCEMICDGKHLHNDIVRMMIRCKGAERTIAITDAMEAAGMPDGEYALGGQHVFVRDQAARLRDGTLAGSVLTMHEALFRLIHVYLIDPYAACAMCTITPAESIGEKSAGHITAGSPAILTRWTKDWYMKSVISANGEICHSSC